MTQSTFSLMNFFIDRFNQEWHWKDIILWLLLLGVVYGFSEYIKHNFIITQDVLWNTYKEQVSEEFFYDFFVANTSKQWINYLIILLFPLKSLIVSLIVSTILFAGGLWLSYDLTYREYWRICFTAEIIIVASNLINMLCILFFVNVQSMEDVASFHRFSLKIFHSSNHFFESYPFRMVNIFEIGYIIFLGWGIGITSGTTFTKGIKLVLLSYVPLLFLWAALMYFIGQGIL